MLNYSNDPKVRAYIDAAHADRSRAMTSALLGFFRALNPAHWAHKGPALANRPS